MWLLWMFLAYTVWYLIWRERYLARVGPVVPCSACSAAMRGPRCPVCGEPRPRRLL